MEITAKFEARRGEDGEFVLALQGPLPPGWAGNLSAGLAARRVDIAHGFASTGGLGCWTALLGVRSRGDCDPRSLDLAALCRRKSNAGFRTPLAIDAFSLVRRRDDGSLHLEIEGRDRVGFLAGLLRRLAYLSLFPVELRLRTEGRRVRDAFLLRAAGGTAPAESAERRLRHQLGQLAAGRERPRGDAGLGLQ